MSKNWRPLQKDRDALKEFYWRIMSIILKLLKFICLFHFLICFKLYSETLILQSSDQHSSYKKMPDFLAGIEVLTRKFKQSHPDGSIILVINGDFSSFEKHSKFMWDRGDFGYSILAQLAEKYEVIYTFGNHDAFDWNNSQLFLDQMNLLKNSGVYLLAANSVFYPEYENLFYPSIDIPLSSNYYMRFIGYTFPNRKEKELLRFNRNSPKVIDKINGINMKPFLSEVNNQDNISAAAVSMHLGIKKTKALISELDPNLKDKLSVVFAGHDHKQELSKTDHVYFVDSRANFNFSQVLLDPYGKVLAVDFFNESSQEELAHSIQKESLESDLIKQTRKFLSLQQKRAAKINPVKILTNIPKREREEPVRALNGNGNKKPSCIKVFQGKKTVDVYQKQTSF